MAKLMGREALFIIAAGLFAQFVFPFLRQSAGLFSIGAIMGLTFTPIYLIALLSGRRMPARVRTGIGVGAWLLAFGPDLVLTTGSLGSLVMVSALLGFVLAGLSALTSVQTGGDRRSEALWGLYAYSLPMVGVRWLLVPLLGGGEFAVSLALSTGALYLGLRGLVRLYWPSSVEARGADESLVHRPVPDRVVGLLEGTGRRRARPFATRPDGTLDEGAVSVVCQPDQAADVERQIAQILADKPFDVSLGQAVAGGVEVVVRPRA